MNKIKKYIKCLSAKQIAYAATVILCLLVWGVLTIFVTVKKNGLVDQNAADRWSQENDTAQISCFFTESAAVDENKIMSFEHQLDAALLEASITAENENARLWADAYSAQGMITMTAGKNSLEAKAVGIGGDFFLFHPVRLLAGSYFSGNDLMQDKIIIDEDAAWQLFGSNDVVGMEVRVGGIPHYIAGVIQREEGRLQEAAGLDKTVVYVSYKTLSELGVTDGMNTYEVVMPDPVDGFAYQIIKEKFGIDENRMWVIENSERYSLKSLLTVISDFGTRSMNAHAIQYPYWENFARGWEDVFAAILVVQIISLLLPALIVTVTVIVLWKRKKWTVKDVLHFLADKKERLAEKYRSEKNKWEHF